MESLSLKQRTALAHLVVAINHDARNEIRIYDAATMETVSLPDMPGAEISSVNISRDEKTIAYYVSGSRNPSDLYVYHLGAEEPRGLTHRRSGPHGGEGGDQAAASLEYLVRETDDEPVGLGVGRGTAQGPGGLTLSAWCIEHHRNQSGRRGAADTRVAVDQQRRLPRRLQKGDQRFDVLPGGKDLVLRRLGDVVDHHPAMVLRRDPWWCGAT